MNHRVVVRELEPGDSIAELTNLLHRAYKELAEVGLNFTASYQDDQTTQRRLNEGTCFLAFDDDLLVGTALLVTDPGDHFPPLYGKPGVCVLGQFGVDPSFRKVGIGDMLLQAVSEKALALGFHTIALDTAKPAAGLIEYYHKRGFVSVGSHQWKGKTYASLLMSKSLGMKDKQDE